MRHPRLPALTPRQTSDHAGSRGIRRRRESVWSRTAGRAGALAASRLMKDGEKREVEKDVRIRKPLKGMKLNLLNPQQLTLAKAGLALEPDK